MKRLSTPSSHAPTTILPLLWCCLAMFAGCGGTDVGNALNVEVQFTGDESTLNSMALSPYAASSSEDGLTVAVFSVHQIALVPGVACQTLNSRPASWYRKREEKQIDWLSSTSQSFSIDVPENVSICRIRLIVAPATSGPYEGYSLYFEGTQNGQRFRVTSQAIHLFSIVAPSAFVISESGRLIETVLFHRSSVSDLSIDSDDLEITPSTRPILFHSFMRTLRSAFRGYRFIRTDNDQRERASEIAEGDAEDEQRVNGEF